MRNLKSILLIGCLYSFNIYAQRPREIQLEDEPFDFSDPFKLVFIVIIPVVLLVIGAILIKKRGKK